ncbi:sialin-like [Brevipalpus obovatus]|uniref:sialin-like n=1 Tax=Brevipalpus obovatus TaxID=246614 RepID=UPI003D9F2048
MGFKLRIRFVVVFVLFLGFVLKFAIVSIPNVTLVAISKAEPMDCNSTKWDHRTRNTIQSALFYGNVLIQLPAGRISELFGVRMTLGPSILVAAILSAFMPLAVRSGTLAAFSLRFIQGIFLGLAFPSMHTLLAQWAPKNERSILSSLIFIGCACGTIGIQIISGYLCEVSLFGGWPLPYYLIGILGFFWFPLWIVFVYDEPEEHPMVRGFELAEINEGRNRSALNQVLGLPLGKILTSLPVIAQIIAQIGCVWTVHFVGLQLPEYMDAVINVKISSNGIYSSLPHIAFALSAFVHGFIGDRLRASGKISITPLRKIFNSIGSLGPAFCFIAIPLIGTDSFKVVMLFNVAMIIFGATTTGSSMINLDMSPTYAGTINGLVSFFSSCTGFLVPIATSWLVGESKEIKDWAKLFFFSSGINIFGALIFCIFADANIQKFDPESHSNSRRTSIRQSVEYNEAIGRGL